MLAISLGGGGFVLANRTDAAFALVSYWHESAPVPGLLIELGEQTGLPVFLVPFTNDYAWWCAIPLNAKAHEHLARPALLRERDWAAFLRRLELQSVLNARQ